MFNTKASNLLLVKKKLNRNSSCRGSWFWIFRWSFSRNHHKWKMKNPHRPWIAFTRLISSRNSFSTFKNKYKSQNLSRIWTLLFRRMWSARSSRKRSRTPKFSNCKNHKLLTVNSETNSKSKETSRTYLMRPNLIKSSTNCWPKHTIKVSISTNLWRIKLWEPTLKNRQMAARSSATSKETSNSFQIWEAKHEFSARKWRHSCSISKFFIRKKASILSWLKISMTKYTMKLTGPNQYYRSTKMTIRWGLRGSESAKKVTISPNSKISNKFRILRQIFYRTCEEVDDKL